MITNKGSDIIARYLLGQAPEFAAYIAVGCGAKPLLNTEGDLSDPSKKTMDFEAFRVPVISRGIVNDSYTKQISSVTTSNFVSIATSNNHGISIGETVHITLDAINITTVVLDATQNTFTFSDSLANGTLTPSSGSAVYTKDRLIFKAQLPPDQRYEMTEIALYPAINNQLAVGHDSKILASFSNNESWSLFGSNELIEFDSNAISNQFNEISPSFSAKFINSDNLAFSGSSVRQQRYESPRFLNKCLIVNGSLCTFDGFNPEIGSIYLSNTNINWDLSKYSKSDVMRLAISVVSQNETDLPAATTKIRLDLIDSSGKISSMRQSIPVESIQQSRYIVINSTLANLYTPDLSFNWSKIVAVNIYASTLNSTYGYDGSYIVLDGLRIDDENITNPLYGMVAYSRLKNSVSNAQPIEKTENSQGYIEYRLGVAIT